MSKGTKDQGLFISHQEVILNGMELHVMKHRKAVLDCLLQGFRQVDV